MSQRRAFSLVELMVVIAVISVLISLLLPAVQTAREAGRRLQCRNNLKQLGLGIANFESAKKRYPQAGLTGDRIKNAITGPFSPTGFPTLSWVVLVLPYIEEEPLYQQFDLGRSVFDQPQEPQATQLALLLCPSEGAGGRFFRHAEETQGKPLAKGNYAAFVSPYHINHTDWWPGGLSGAHKHTPKDIADGLSRTFLLSEVRTRANEADQRGAWALPWAGSSLLSYDMHNLTLISGSWYLQSNFAYVPVSEETPVSPSLGLTQRPNNQIGNTDMLYLCPDPEGAQLEGMPCDTYVGVNDKSEQINRWLSAAPRSLHPGGVHTVFLDGHVTFVPDNIDEYVMAYLVAINDGQAVDIETISSPQRFSSTEGKNSQH